MSLQRYLRFFVFLSLLGWTTPGHALLLTDDLIAYWSMEETSGTRTDSAGTNDLTDNGGVAATPGIVGNAAALGSTSGQYLSLPDNPDLSVGDIDFTVVSWVYMNELPPPTGFTTQAFVLKGDYGVTFDNEYLLRYNGGNDRFEFFVTDGSSAVVTARSNTFGAASANTWYMVAGWHDSSADTVGIQINEFATGSDITGYSSGSHDTTTEFSIGGGATVSGEFTKGAIDEVGFWKRILTAAERDNLYNEPEFLPNLLNNPPPAASVIPEPSSLLLLGSGLLGLAFFRRKLLP
jgi:hypothetical protein